MSDQQVMIDSLTERLAKAEQRLERHHAAFWRWWVAKRPAGWSEDQHRANPFICCSDGREKGMIRAGLGMEELE